MAEEHEQEIICLDSSSEDESDESDELVIDTPNEDNENVKIDFLPEAVPTIVKCQEQVTAVREAIPQSNPFSCSQCNRIFMSEHHLKSHLLSHSDEKPFTCDKCRYRGKTLHFLALHKANQHSQTSRTLFQCLHCLTTFEEKKVLVQHQKRDCLQLSPQLEKTATSLQFSSNSGASNTSIQHKIIDPNLLKGLPTYPVLTVPTLPNQSTGTIFSGGPTFTDRPLGQMVLSSCSLNLPILIPVLGDDGSIRYIPQQGIVNKISDCYDTSSCAKGSNTISQLEEESCAVDSTTVSSERQDITPDITPVETCSSENLSVEQNSRPVDLNYSSKLDPPGTIFPATTRYRNMIIQRGDKCTGTIANIQDKHSVSSAAVKTSSAAVKTSSAAVKTSHIRTAILPVSSRSQNMAIQRGVKRSKTTANIQAKCSASSAAIKTNITNVKLTQQPELPMLEVESGVFIPLQEENQETHVTKPQYKKLQKNSISAALKKEEEEIIFID